MKKELPPIEYVKTDPSRLFKSKAQILADDKAEKDKKIAMEAFGKRFSDENKGVDVSIPKEEIVQTENEPVKPKMGRPKKVQESV